MASNQTTSVIIAMLIITCLISSSSVQAAGDENLIKKMCDATYVPTICKSCVDTDGREVHSELDVVFTVLRCAYNDSDDLFQNTQQIANDATDVKVKNVLNECAKNFEDIFNNGEPIRYAAVSRNFANAKKLIQSLVFEKLGFCNVLLTKSGIAIPPVVFSGAFSVEADYKMADQLLSIIKP